MRKLPLAALAAVAGLIVAAPMASAQTWRPVARQCAKEIGEQGGKWALWAKCTIDRVFPTADPARVQTCIQQVAQFRDLTHACNECGDPVRSVIDCATGQ
jgi:hypothetical protein